MSDKARGYAHRVDIVADVHRVWLALTEAEHLVRWCSPGAQIRARQGGLFRASVDRVTELEAHIDVFEPARRMRLIYLPSQALPYTDSAIVDDFILEPVAPGTILRLLGSGVPGTPEWDTQYRRLRMGWQQAITRLKVFVEKQLNGEAS
ncbi:MAG: SRPBCC family protein [Steroidobacteraceae bacterium]